MPDFLLPVLTPEMWLPLVSSLLTGMLIGLDRELQGKPAGLRTHTLVCFAATLLTLAAALLLGPAPRGVDGDGGADGFRLQHAEDKQLE